MYLEDENAAQEDDLGRAAEPGLRAEQRRRLDQPQGQPPREERGHQGDELHGHIADSINRLQ